MNAALNAGVRLFACAALALSAGTAWALSVTLTSPAAGSVFAAPATINLAATATPTSQSRPIVKVEFYRGGSTLIGTATAAPYTYTWTNVAAGTYSLTAKATDSSGATATSKAVSITVDVPPSVSLTAPANNSVFAPGATITLNASASDSDGTISKVEFFRGATLLGSDTTSPYSFTWNSVPRGSYSLTAKATDNNGIATTSAAAAITVDTAPTVSITAPANNSVFIPPANVAVTANAVASAGGSIAKVEFFDGATLAATVTAAPFSTTLANLASGSHTLTARATDDLGLATTSTAVTVRVDALPAVSITAPANNSVFTAPANITVSASASDPDGSLTKVEFFDGATLVGTVTAAPYSITLTNVAVGAHSYTAKAIDNDTASTTSAAVAVNVNPPPTVTLTSPTQGALFTAPASIALAADTTGAIAKVDFYRGATLINTITTPPYVFTWGGVSQGTYALTAVATDTAGASATSAVVNVSVRAAVQLDSVQYFYDEVGRLIQVIDRNGDSAHYAYDAAGNIVQIERFLAGTLSITGFAPKSGAVGASVAIYGSGFSTTVANNNVQFNGTTAVVTAASDNRLVATVPSGATTGPISVTVGAQSATSGDNFSVKTGSGAAPTITGFTPAGGPAGTAVTINGTNFDPVVANNIVRFNDAAQAVVSSATSVQIATSVPTYAGSGHISVRTPYGVAVSGADFIIPPSGYVYADIIATARVAIGGSTSLAISTANKHGLALFDGAAGDYLSLQLSSLTVSPNGSVSYKVFDPTNAQIASGSVSSTAMSIHLPPLKRGGTYSVIFSPGNATANLTFGPVRNTIMSAAQPTLNANVAVAGQSIRGIFTGTAGAALTLRLSVSSTTPADQAVTLSVYKPDGAQIATTTGTQSGDGSALYVASLPVAGNYTVLVAPPSTATGTMTVTLNPSMDVLIDGASLNVSSTTAGYTKRYLFAGTGGQRVSVALNGLAFTPGSSLNAKFWVYNPDGSQLMYMDNCYTGNPGSNCFSANNVLPVTGTYTVAIAPASGTTFSGTLTLSSVVTGTLLPGSPLSVNLTRPGHHARLTFSGTAGQAATIRLAVGDTVPAAQNVSVSIWRAGSGTVVLDGGAVNASGDGAVLYIASLPATDTYYVYVIPWFNATGPMTVTLNPAMDVAVDGATVNVASTTAGYTKRYLFAGTAGQRVSVALNGIAFTPASSSNARMWVYNPDGTLLMYQDNCYTSNPASNCFSLNNVLPVSGTYTIAIAPPSNSTFSGTLTISSVVTGTLTSGTPFSANLTRPGHHARLDFSGTAGQAATIRLAVGDTVPAAQNVSVSIWRAGSGTVVLDGGAVNASGDGAVLYIASLPATDTYYVYVIPWFNATGTMTVTLNPAMDVTIDGASVNVASTTAGYTKRYLFAGTAGQRVSVALNGLAFTPGSSSNARMWIYNPDGTQLMYQDNCYTSNPGSNCFSLNNVPPVTGTYTIAIAPPSGSTFSGTLTVSSLITGTLTSGTPLTVNFTRPGHHARLDFSGTAGQAATVRIAIGSPTVPAGQNVSVSIWRAGSGSVVLDGGAVASGSSKDLTLTSLPATDTYYVWLIPWFNATGMATVTLNP